MADQLSITSSRLEHYSGISRAISGISSRMAALAKQFATVAPRTELDDANMAVLAAGAAQMLQAAQALGEIEYTPPPPPEENGEDDGDPGDEA